MKAAVVRAHGGPEALAFEADFPDPRPGEGDVIVAVKASSLNYHDVFTRRGNIDESPQTGKAPGSGCCVRCRDTNDLWKGRRKDGGWHEVPDGANDDDALFVRLANAGAQEL